MSSVVEICNTALIELGAEPISSLTETSPQATACNAVWEQSRRAVLRVHAWNFSTKTEDLAPLTTNVRKFRYDYSYQVPSESLRLLKVLDDDDYKLEANVIFTNRDICKIKYIYDNTSTATWDALFVDLMSAKVQAKIAMAITRDRATAEFAESLYQMRLITAQSVDSSEDIEDQIITPETNLLASRF